MDPDLEFRAQLRDKRAYPLMAAALLMLAAVVGISLLPSNGGAEGRGLAVPPSPSPAPARSTSPSSAATGPGSDPISRQIVPGGWSMTWAQGWIRLSVPAGWSWTDGPVAGAARTIYKGDDDGVGNAPTLTVQDVTLVAANPCAMPRSFEEVGPTVEDLTTALTTALADRAGIESVGPTDVVLGGYAAKRLVLTIPGSCPDPGEGTLIWEDVMGSGFGVLEGGTATIYIVDVDGERLVITSHYRGASAGDVAELEAIIDSIDVEVAPPSLPPPEFPVEEDWVFPPAGELAPGWYPAIVGSNQPNPASPSGFGFLFYVPTSGWISSGPDAEGMGGSISKGTALSADGAVIRFSNPDRVHADPCTHTLGPPVGESVDDLVAAMATIPGIDVTGPFHFGLKYSTAKHLVLTVRDDIACEPQDFYLWHDEVEGPRSAAALGSKIQVWIFNPNNRPIFGRIVIEAETYEGAGPEIEREIRQIVYSIEHGG